MSIPVFWLSKKDRTCARCRLDEQYVEDLISGTLKQPDSWWPGLKHIETNFVSPCPTAVVCFPAGAHLDDDVAWLNREISRIDNVILFVTSDEASRFPIHLIKHRHMKLWVMEPRPEVTYPPGTSFIGCGSARAGTLQTLPLQRVTAVWFAGQVNHGRREEMWEASDTWGDWKGTVALERNESFMSGEPREVYLAKMAGTKVAPCPAGIHSQDSFRLHEALDLGAMPLADAYRPDGGGKGYWDMVMPGHPFPTVDDWHLARTRITNALMDYPWGNIHVHAWWHQYRRDLARRFRDQLGIIETGPTFTVVIPTSPIPSHPDTKILERTVFSIRERTDAEILIMCDGVRGEQRDRRDDYGAYLQQVCGLAEQWDNVTPVVMKRFCHQAEMLRRTLVLVGTEHVLFVEHDTPLVGEIDFPAVLTEMDYWGLNALRFYHEVAIHPEHAHLMFNRLGSFRQTLQWSQRPHLARTDWYRDILDDFFDPSARTMIEDVMVGPLEHSLLTKGADGWDDWRIAVYEPNGNIQRSIHTDGRAGAPKYDMRYRYPNGEAPAGAPRPR